VQSLDKEIISVLLKSIHQQGLITESVYHLTLDRLHTFDTQPFHTYSNTQEDKECVANGYPKS